MQKYSALKIQNAIQNIRQSCSNTVCNYFEFFTKNILFDAIFTERTIVFGREEGQIYRVFFCTGKLEELSGLLKVFPEHSVVDVITNNRMSISEVLHQLHIADYEQRNIFERYCISSLGKGIYKELPKEFQNLEASHYGEYAKEEDAAEILQMLKDSFDPKQNHLEDIHVLKEMIRNRQVRIISDQGKIAALITFRMQGRKLYIEHLVNRGQRVYSYSLYLYILEAALSKGIQCVNTWIAEDNLRSQRFAKHFGYEKDGLVDFIWVKEK